MARSRIDLIVWQDGKAVRRKILDEGVHIIGRGSEANLTLFSERISRNHAQLSIGEGGVTVEDLDSRNGVFYDGKRVKKMALRDGDYVFIDPFVLEFQIREIETSQWSPRPRVVLNKGDTNEGPTEVRLHTAQLVRLSGSRQNFMLNREVNLMGRGSEHPVQIVDTSVSRDHAEIKRLGNAWVIRDLGSANGTHVNGKEIRQTTLRNGDRVQIGRTLFRFDLRPMAASARHAS